MQRMAIRLLWMHCRLRTGGIADLPLSVVLCILGHVEIAYD